MSYSPNFRGNSAAGASMANASTYQNGTLSTVGVAVAVSTNTSGQFLLTDVSSESSVEAWLGLTNQTIPSAAYGQIYADGRLQNIPLGFGFSVGDPIWVGTSPGSLTNVKPDIGAPGWSTGMFVLFVGVVVQNEFNPFQQDIQILRQNIGQL